MTDRLREELGNYFAALGVCSYAEEGEDYCEEGNGCSYCDLARMFEAEPERPHTPSDPVAEQLARLRATHGPEAPTGGEQLACEKMFLAWAETQEHEGHEGWSALRRGWDAAWEARGAEVARETERAKYFEAAARDLGLEVSRGRARLAEVEAERDRQVSTLREDVAACRSRCNEQEERGDAAEARAEQAERDLDEAMKFCAKCVLAANAKGRAEATEAAARVCEVKAEKHRRPRVNRAENDACAVALDVAASDIRASTHRKAPGDAALEADKVNPQWTGHGPTEWRWDGNAGTWVAAWAYGHLHVRRLGESDDLGIAVPDHIVDRCLQDRPTHRKGDAGPDADGSVALEIREALTELECYAREYGGPDAALVTLSHAPMWVVRVTEPVPTEGPAT
jgi:hypothetical protein